MSNTTGEKLAEAVAFMQEGFDDTGLKGHLVGAHEWKVIRDALELQQSEIQRLTAQVETRELILATIQAEIATANERIAALGNANTILFNANVKCAYKIECLESTKASAVSVPRELYDSVKQLLISCSFSHETEYDGRTYEICDLCDKQDGEHTDDCLSHAGDKVIAQFLSAGDPINNQTRTGDGEVR